MTEHPVYSWPQAIRKALEDHAWRLMRKVIPSTTVEAGPLDPGDAPPLPTLGLFWGAAQAFDVRAEDEVTLDDGRAVWRVHTEETPIAWVFRSRKQDEAELFAHEFVGRMVREMVRSNDQGNRVLHFQVSVGGIKRTAKFYLDGQVQPFNPDDAALRSLYALRVPGTVVYPVMRLDDPGDRVGRMKMVVVVGGRTFKLDTMGY